VPRTTTTPDPEQAAGLDEVARSEPTHGRDQAPTFMLRGQEWLHRWLSNESRSVLGLGVVIFAVLVVLVLSSLRFLQVVFEALDIVAFVGLFLVNWLGNGGALVPIPGARFAGLLLIFQQAVLLPSWEVFAVAGGAMALGLLSYYIAGARTAKSYAAGDSEGAQQLATETGMLDDERPEFSPGAELDADVVTAIAGSAPPAPATSDGPSAVTQPASRLARLRARFSTSLKRAQERARPVIEQRGLYGMFLLCFAPTPLGTAAAYLGGLMRFSFSRYLLASFAAKYLLAGIIVALALVFNEAARSVQLP
jgi:hypothetical protein